MPSTNHERTRVLVVDDEPSIVELITTILAQQGYETASAANGALAIEAARSFRPQCVITDVLMPVMDGIEAAMRIREMLPECKVLLISGQVSAVDLLRESRAKGLDFPLLSKPMPVAELLRSVAAAVGQN